VLGSDTKYAVRPKGGRKPDVAVYVPGRPAPPAQGVVRVPPDIMMEVISRAPSDARRDRIDKPLDYAAFGVRYYWLVDPVARTVEVFELQAARRYLRLGGASQGELDVPGCPGLRLDLDALWAQVARLAPPAPTRPRTARASHKTRAKR
jgi:Uma2 family endonuclease